MSKFTPTRRGNPCQLCDDTCGKCRETDSTLLCMTFAEASAAILGYKFIGRTKDNLWGKWVVDDGQDWSAAQPDQWRQEQQQIKAQRQQEEAQRHRESLSAIDRDHHYQRLLNQLSLNPADRNDLLRRGLTNEQIAAGGFKSVEPWQPLAQELPHTLPGVNLEGRSLNVASAGYLCPIRDVNGRIVACQIRSRDGEAGGRYRWLSSKTQKRDQGPQPHLRNAELPLAIHRPPQVQRRAIALVEGTGAKPLILCQRREQVTIGAAGGQFASSADTLQQTLEVLAVELDTQEVEFYVDAGAVGNQHVMRQYRATWKRLREWGYTIRVAWWGQVTKADLDIDELEDFSEIEWLTTAQLEAVSAQRNSGGSVHSRLDWLKQIQQRLQRALQSQTSALALQRKLDGPDKPDHAVIEYSAGDRHSIWQQAVRQGYRHVLDQSPTGTGKSFDAGTTEPSVLEAQQLIYASDQHRNPTVETLAQGWVDLEARHAGLHQELTPGGGSRWKRSASGETPSVSANCTRTRVIGALRAKQVHGADTASLICGTCPLREACTHATGPGYGFLQQRHLALSSLKLRAHPDSLPNPLDYEYEAVGVIWDEPGQSFVTKRDVQVTLVDLEQTTSALLPYPHLLAPVQEMLATLLLYLNGQRKLGRFGLNPHEVMQTLPVPTIEIQDLEQVLQPDLSFLNTTAAHGIDLADLPTHLRKRFSERDSEMAEQAQHRVIKQWLPDLLRVLMGQQAGSVRLESGQLALSLADTRHRTIAQAAGVVIFLDATLSRQDLALKLNCQPDDIFVCRQRVPASTTLTITQVTDLGRMGMQRGKDQQQRASAIMAHYQAIDPQTKVIDFKRFVDEGMGAWWRDSRGVNDFTETKTLILVGTPCRNLADLRAEFAVLTGVSDPEVEPFQAFVDRTILADVHQAIGRLRAHRRLDEALQVILLSDFVLDIPTQPMKASAITLEAAGKKERLLLAAKAAVEQLNAQGKKVTQTAVAAMAGYSQQRISEIWKLLLLLLETPNSKSSKNPSSNSSSSEAELITGMSQAVSTLIADCDEVQLPEAIRDVFLEWLEPRQRTMLWQRMSVKEQIRVLSALLLTLPSKTLAAVEKDE